MAPCIILAWGRFGNRLPISTSTWLSHPPPPSPGPPTWFPFSPPTPPPFPPNLARLLLSQDGEKERQKKIFTVQWVWQRLKVCNHAVLFLIMIRLIVDTSRGENVLDCVGVVEERTVKIPKDQKPQNNSMSNTVKIWAGGVWFGPKGTVGELSRH